MDDLISRQAAIDGVKTLHDVAWKNWHEPTLSANVVIDILKELPSAQPEVVRCKDCRWGREACGNIECWVDTNIPPEYHGYEWFCPNGERRTDEQMDV